MSAEAATRALGGKWTGRSGIAFCPVHENRNTPALSLSDGEDGKLLVHCFAGCDGADILREINRRGCGGSDIRVTTDSKPDRRKSDRKEFALALWREAYPIRDSLVERYLFNREIKPPLPASLRFHPSLLHSPSQTRHPAMIGLVTTGKTNEATGIHRTYLSPNGHKANVKPCKMMLGNCGGGAVRLTDESDGPVLICEGIETGLSLRDALAFENPTPRIWAALSTSGIAGLNLSDLPKAIVIAPDGDEPGYCAADKLAKRAKDEGRNVRIMTPPPGKDWNDVARDIACGGSI